MKSFRFETLLLITSIALSIFFVLYLTYCLNASATSKRFLQVLIEALDFSKAMSGFSLSHTLILLSKSTILVVICLVSSFILGFLLSKYQKLSAFFNVLSAVPELFIATFLRATIWNPVKNAENEFVKGLIICFPIIIRSTAVMYKYFHIAREKYSNTYFYYLTIVRKMSNFKKTKYLIQSTFLDAMSNVIYEFPLLISYVALLERLFDFKGLSREFANNIIYSTPELLLRITLFILGMLAIFQTMFLSIVRTSDKR